MAMREKSKKSTQAAGMRKKFLTVTQMRLMAIRHLLTVRRKKENLKVKTLTTLMFMRIMVIN